MILICLAIALSLRSWPVVAFLVPVVLIQLATAPLSAHMVGRQAYRNGTIDGAALVRRRARRVPADASPPPAAEGTARTHAPTAHAETATARRD